MAYIMVGVWATARHQPLWPPLYNDVHTRPHPIPDLRRDGDLEPILG